jgi:proteasome assembly chaperone (PAC2) family protein
MNDHPSPLKFLAHPELDNPALIMSWTGDTGGLGARVTDHLVSVFGGRPFCEIEPVEFWPFDGVAVEKSILQFPEVHFVAGTRRDMVIFQSPPPAFNWYRLLDLVLEAAQQVNVREIYAVGAMVSMAVHTSPRQVLATFSSPQIKDSLVGYDLGRGWDFETPPGQRPTLNTFLVWAAQRRNVAAVALWVPVPFYLVSTDDPRAQRRVLSFFDERFNLGLDYTGMDRKVSEQDARIEKIRASSPETDQALKKLEGGEALSQEESQRLAGEIERALSEKSG